jgi:hypothetical protein
VAQTIELADLLLAAMDARMAMLFTSMPGRILSYHQDRQAANVQPTVRSSYVSEIGVRIPDPLPMIPSVPVVFLGGGSFRTTYPVAAGDTCLLLFANCSLDRWLAQGGGDVDPGDDRRHYISDAIALVGLRDFRHSLKNAPSDRMSMGHDGGATIEVYEREVRVGGNAGAEPTLKGNSYKDALSLFLDALNTFAGTCVTAPSGTATALATAVTAFKTAMAASLSSVAKVV